MRKNLEWSVAAAIACGLIVAPHITAAAWGGKPSRRALRSSPQPAAPVVAESPNRRTESTAPRPTALDDSALAEILRIRDAHGSVLQGSLLEAPRSQPTQPPQSQPANDDKPFSLDGNQDAFRDALQRIIEQRPHETTHEPRGAIEPADRPPQLRAPDQPLIIALRAASRALDSRANDFEDARQFPDAERLRTLANHLRHEARSLEGAAADPPAARY